MYLYVCSNVMYLTFVIGLLITHLLRYVVEHTNMLLYLLCSSKPDYFKQFNVNTFIFYKLLIVNCTYILLGGF